MRFLVVGFLLLTGCAAPGPAGRAGGASSAGQGAAPAAPQRAITIAITREPPAMDPSFIAGPNGADYVALGTAFLAYIGPSQEPRPYLAQVLPTVENGAWKVLPDGRMETTYTLNRGARWHDGHPVTAGDFVFAYEVNLDPVVPSQRGEVVRRLGSIRAENDYTLYIEWREPYMWAGALHAPDFAPSPRHLLEGVKGLVTHSPAPGLVDQPGQGIADGVKVGRHVQSPDLRVVAGVGDDRQIMGIDQVSEAAEELGGAGASRERDELQCERTARPRAEPRPAALHSAVPPRQPNRPRPGRPRRAAGRRGSGRGMNP